MNDDIKKINERNKEIDFPPKSEGNFSQAKKSTITTNEEDKKISMAEGIINDISNLNAGLDSCKQGIIQLNDQINKQTTLINQIVQTLQGSQPLPQTAQGLQGLNMDTVTAFGDLLEKGAAAWKSLKGGNESVMDEFTKSIVDKSKREALESLNIVSLINQKVKKHIVNDIAGDVAGNVINDSTKQNLHDPQ